MDKNKRKYCYSSCSVKNSAEEPLNDKMPTKSKMNPVLMYAKEFSLVLISTSLLCSAYLYLPVIGSIICFLTFIICLIIAFSLHQLPESTYIPFISFLGFQNPGRPIYAVGFTLGGICYLISFFFVYNHVFVPLYAEAVEKFKGWLKFALSLCFFCPFMLATQAIIPLQSDIYEVQEKMIMPSPQSLVHQGSALVLFLLALFHSCIICQILKKTKENYVQHASILIKDISFIFMTLSLILSIIFHPASNLSRVYTVLSRNIGGLAQWVFVFSMMLFFSSYSIDFYTSSHMKVSE